MAETHPAGYAVVHVEHDDNNAEVDEGGLRHVYLPLKTLRGKTDRIELDSFYPFLAFMANYCHIHPDVPPHFALQYPIVNDVSLDDTCIQFSDGRRAKRVIVDDTVSANLPAMAADHKRWFAKARSDSVASKLWQRIVQEDYALPIVTSVAIAILAEMYTTTSGTGSAGRRVRLKYKSSPIADFGIAKGAADVKGQDCLSYLRLSNNSVVHGQNPAEHYWLWFKTIRGEELELDFSMFTFNFGLMVHLKDFLPPELYNLLEFAPVYYKERDTRKNTPPLHAEKSRLSVLRDPDLHRAVVHSYDTFSEHDIGLVVAFMERLAGRKMRPVERHLTGVFSSMGCRFIGMNLQARWWAKYPTTVSPSVWADPGELDDFDDPNTPWAQSMRDFQRRRRHRS
ncbi:hypothetical protein EIP86_003699 [Pleurotus ostreatoroseus]|nr:hypothetical protein EIP86_003699 [Pleurotus ostreatoroseus]